MMCMVSHNYLLQILVIKISAFTLKLYMVQEKISRLCRECPQLYKQIMCVEKFRCETHDISVKYQCGSHNLVHSPKLLIVSYMRQSEVS